MAFWRHLSPFQEAVHPSYPEYERRHPNVIPPFSCCFYLGISISAVFFITLRQLVRFAVQMMLDADVMNVRFLMSANADVAEFIAKEGSKVTQKPVKELGMPIGVTIGGLVRGEEGMLVSGNTQIEPGDSVMVFCHNINMKKIEKYFI